MNENRRTNVLQILVDYQATTERLLALFTIDAQPPDVERLQQLLAEREQLLDLHRQLPGNAPETPDVQALVTVIREQDEQVSVRLATFRQKLLDKINSLQQQKRGLGAYRNPHVIGAAFIDSKK